MKTKQEITLDDPLQNGDVIELHFETLGFLWIRAATIGLLEKRLAKKHPNFEIIGTQIPDEKKLIFTIRVREPPADQVQVQTAAVISPALIVSAVIVIGGGLFLYLSLSKVYKIIETPTGKVGAISLALVAGGIILLLLRRK